MENVIETLNQFNQTKAQDLSLKIGGKSLLFLLDKNEEQFTLGVIDSQLGFKSTDIRKEKK